MPVHVRECPPSAVSAAPLHTVTLPDESPVIAAVPELAVWRKPETHIVLTGKERKNITVSIYWPIFTYQDWEILVQTTPTFAALDRHV